MIAYHQVGILAIVFIIAFAFPDTDEAERLVQRLSAQIADANLQGHIGSTQITQVLQQPGGQFLAIAASAIRFFNGNVGDLAFIKDDPGTGKTDDLTVCFTDKISGSFVFLNLPAEILPAPGAGEGRGFNGSDPVNVS